MGLGVSKKLGPAEFLQEFILNHLQEEKGVEKEDSASCSFRSSRHVRDRATSELFEEYIPGPLWSVLRGMYPAAACSIVPARRLAWLLRRITRRAGRKMKNLHTKRDIPNFVKTYNINMQDVLRPLEDFQSMNDFFIRELRRGARPIDSPNDASVFVSCADCRLIAFPSWQQAARVWVKGRAFSIPELLGSEEDALPFVRGAGCSLALFRLAPQDYHRFHFPCGPGRVVHQRILTGSYYTVNPVAINHPRVDVLTENARVVNILETSSFGRIALVAVGATLVGSVEMLKDDQKDSVFEKGDCFGYFQYGGSTCVVLAEAGRLDFDKDILETSLQGIETYVRVGERIGCRKGPPLGYPPAS